MVAVTGTALATMVVTASPAMAVQPDGPAFVCTGQVFLVQGVAANTSQLFVGDFGSGTISFNSHGPTTTDYYNAIGYNPANNYIYGIREDTGGLWGVDANGVVTMFGRPTGLPAPGTAIAGATIGDYNLGAFGDDGLFYVGSGPVPRLWVIDTETNSVVRTIVLSQAINGYDITFAHGYFWAAQANGTVRRIDPNTGTVTSFPGVLPPTIIGDELYGGVFTYGNGDLGFYDNSGRLYRIAVTNPSSANPTFTMISTQTGPSSNKNDATSCNASPVDLSVVKDGPAQVAPGGTVTYTLTVQNNGPGASTGWSLVDELPAGLVNPQTSTPGCEITDSTLSCTGGALSNGATAVVTVTGTAPASPTQLVNTAQVFGNDPDPNPGNDTSTVTTQVEETTAPEPAVVADDSATTPMNTPVTIPILGNDTIPPGSSAPTIASPPSNGTVTINPDGTATYTPNPGFTGTDTFTYTVTGPDGNPVTATVTVAVVEDAEVPVMSAPVGLGALLALGAGALLRRRFSRR